MEGPSGWTIIDPINTPFFGIKNPTESLYEANVPWNPEHLQYEKAEVNAGNGAFVPKVGYPSDMFKYREDVFRVSNPVRPYFGPEGSFLVMENDHD